MEGYFKEVVYHFMKSIYNRLLLNNLKVISQKYGHNI